MLIGLRFLLAFFKQLEKTDGSSIVEEKWWEKKKNLWLFAFDAKSHFFNFFS